MNKPMDEKDKRFQDAQQGQESKRRAQEGGGAKPQPRHGQQNQGEQSGEQDPPRGAQ